MSRFEVIDVVNDPGVPGRSGDDRFGYDPGAGTAWVLDGATDVTDLKPFPRAESGAAWVAEALSGRLMLAPGPDQPASDYWHDVLVDVRTRAARESEVALDSLPPEARPIAAGVWMRALPGSNQVEFAWLGDCLALVGLAGGVETIGTPEKADEETETARRLLRLSPEERLEALRAARRHRNQPGRAIFGIDPAAARFLNLRTLAIPPGTDILLMSDGLYRLVSPYGVHTPASLMEAVREEGLIALLRRLRAEETADTDDAERGRLKTRDDACGVYLRME